MGRESGKGEGLAGPGRTRGADNGDAPREYRLGLANFYVLTRYNRSSFYATAVADLAAALRAEFQPEGR